MASGSRKNSLKPALSVMSVGIEMGVAVAVGFFAGSWLDSRLGTEPWLMCVFVVFGIVAAFKGLWRTAKKYWDDGDGSGGANGDSGGGR